MKDLTLKETDPAASAARPVQEEVSGGRGLGSSGEPGFRAGPVSNVLRNPALHPSAALALAACAQFFEGHLVDGDLKGGGHILQATSGSGANRQTYSYSTDRVVGNGSFGVVFQATCLETGETVRAGRGGQSALTTTA